MAACGPVCACRIPRLRPDAKAFAARRFTPISQVMNEVTDPLYKKALLRLAADAAGAGTLPAPDGADTMKSCP